jgi:hypothetical protein
VLGMLMAFPALASAQQSFSVTSPTGFPAGGDPSYTTTENLDTSHGAPHAVQIALAPGVLASLTANTACLHGPPQHTSACHIGDGSASAGGLPVIQTAAYLVHPPPGDAAGIDLVSNPGNQVTNVGVALQQTASGNVESVLNLDLSSLGMIGQTLTSISLTVNGTLGGKPFTRMPTNCSPGHSALKITYADGTTETSTASPDFAPTGCASLPFNPTLTATAIKDPHDSGVQVVTTQTQAANEAAGESTTLILPWPTLSANLSSLTIQNTSTAVGSAVATSPLQPAPLSGLAYLTGGPFTPTLTLRFPPPVALTLVGTVSLTNHSVTFSNLPDVPQTSLVVTLYGGSKAAESTSCAPPGGTAQGIFVGQNGATVRVSQPLTVSGCPSAPSISHASLSGLVSGRPSVRFKLTRGSDAPSLKSIVVALPHGLSFSSKKLGRGISVSARHTVALHGGKLTLTLKPAVVSVSVTIGGTALIESKQLKRQARSHPAGSRKAQISVTDADGSTSSFVATG